MKLKLKPKKVKVDKEYLEFLMEKARERCELYSENVFLRWKLANLEEAIAKEMGLK